MAQQDLNAVGMRILDASRAALMIELPYLDVLLCALQSRNGEDVTSSIATDGQYLFYTGSYLADLYLRSSVKTNRTLLHILLHCMLRHPFKSAGKDLPLWDLACDTAVESILDSLPCRCLKEKDVPARQKFYAQCLAEMRVLTAESIYRKLLRDRRSEYEIAVLQRLFLADDHSPWQKQEDETNGKEQEERWKNIASQVSTAMSASLTRQADGGETLTEQARIAARDETDYRAFLRRFAAPREILKSDDDAFDPIYYTYGLQTFGNMPLIEPPETREERRIEDLVIAIDTSMSTTGETVRAFLSTTYSILRTSESFTRKFNIRIIQCDDRVRSDTVITDASQLKAYMDRVTLSGGSSTDFRPVFAHVEELRKQGALPALRGLLYFTDGMGIYPTHRTDYETAFILPEEPPLAYHVPPWAIRIVLDMAETDRATPEDWEDELKDEMPEL